MFGLMTISRQAILAQCKIAADRSSQFGVSFTSAEVTYDPFEKEYKLLLISFAGRFELAALHHQIYQGIQTAERNVAIPYRPHMTVATNPDRRIIEQLDISFLGGFPLTGTIRALEVVELENSRLHHRRTIPFGGLR